MIDGSTRGDAILDLMVNNAGDLIVEVKAGGNLGCSDHSLRDMGQAKITVKTLNLRKTKFQLFK